MEVSKHFRFVNIDKLKEAACSGTNVQVTLTREKFDHFKRELAKYLDHYLIVDRRSQEHLHVILQMALDFMGRVTIKEAHDSHEKGKSIYSPL